MLAVSDWVKITGKASTRTEHHLIRGHGVLRVQDDNNWWVSQVTLYQLVVAVTRQVRKCKRLKKERSPLTKKG